MVDHDVLIIAEIIKADDVLCLSMFVPKVKNAVARIYLDRNKMDFSTMIVEQQDSQGNILWTGANIRAVAEKYLGHTGWSDPKDWVILDMGQQKIFDNYLRPTSRHSQLSLFNLIADFQETVSSQKRENSNNRKYIRTCAMMDKFNAAGVPEGFDDWVESLFVKKSNPRAKKEEHQVACLQTIDNQIAIRYFKFLKYYSKNDITGEREESILNEIESVRFMINKKNGKTVKYELVNDWYHGDEVWKKRSGIGNNIKNYKVFSDNLKEVLAYTPYQYCKMEKLAENGNMFNPIDYLSDYLIFPVIEYIANAGLYNILADLLKFGGFWKYNSRAKNLQQYFGITSNDFQLLKKVDSNQRTLDQFIKLKKVKVATELDLLLLKECRFEDHNFDKLMEHEGDPIRNIKYLRKQAGKKTVNAMVETYFDYLGMAEQEKWDLTEKHNLWPKNLIARHDQLVDIINQRKDEERMKKLRKTNRQIRNRKKKLDNLYCFKSGGLLIKAPEGAKEIIQEGQKLGHCVGSDRYIKDHASGETTILFIREADQPEVPFYTVEFINGKVFQVKGKRNIGPTDEVKAFMKNWESAIFNDRIKKECS